MATRAIRAPRGTRLSCKGWRQEAALRMLMNNLDKEALSVGLAGNCADVLPELARCGIVPDLLTDQSSAQRTGLGLRQ